MKRIALMMLVVVLVFYVAVSISFSLVVGLSPESAYGIVTNRAPFVVVEAVSAVVCEEDGHVFGMTDDGFYLSYDENDGALPGDTITTIVVYNPFNNYVDDIIWRIDF